MVYKCSINHGYYVLYQYVKDHKIYNLFCIKLIYKYIFSKETYKFTITKLIYIVK
jgi:hypothetical protein